MTKNWSLEPGSQQAMVAKRMFQAKLHNLHTQTNHTPLSFIGFEISKTVWSNQLNIIPLCMKIMATLARFFGTFISIEECGEIMTPLFTEAQEESLKKSGKFITWKKNEFTEITENSAVLNTEMKDRLWKVSLDLCADDTTTQIAAYLHKL
jgi:hypothetical protein